MKHGKRPTRSQKAIISSFRLIPENWLVINEDKEYIRIMHKHTGNVRTIKKTF